MTEVEQKRTDLPTSETIADINRMIILNTGRVFIGAQASLWKIDHSNFSSSCQGQITIVAEAKNGTYKSTGDYCSGCQTNVGLDISIRREDLITKVREDKRMEEIRERLGLNEVLQDLTE